MKIVIAIVVLFLGALGFWIFMANDDSIEVDQGLIDEPSKTRDVNQPVTETQNKAETQPAEIPNETSVDDEKQTEAPYPKKEELANDQYADDIEDDYGEEVSREDFADFITTALEEITEEDEPTSLAIVSEMGKIVDAQAAHRDEGLRFFRGCVEHAKLSDRIKDRCRQELEKREK